MVHISKKIMKHIGEAKTILLIPHQKPDGDALGSSTAMAAYLEQIGKKVLFFCATDIPQSFSYLPHTAIISQDPNIWEQDIDLIMVFDSGDLGYAGVDTYIERMSKKPSIINIDHHMTNQFYGDINMVNTAASSTCEIVYYFFKANAIAVSKTMATSLLTGIITDTDNFTNSATSPTAIAAASALTRLGADYNTIKSRVYKSTPIQAFEVWGKILSRLKKHEPLNIVYTHIHHSDLEKHGLTEESIAGATNFMNSIHDGHAGMILKELPDGRVKGSFRTTRDDVNVARMAQHFGGGGHKKAAGFTVDGPLNAAIGFVLKELETLFPHGSILELEDEQA